MRKNVWIYGLVLAIFILILKYLEIKYKSKLLSTEIYSGLFAIIFTSFGIWLALKWSKPKAVAKNSDFVIKELNLSVREMEVLHKIAEGLTNKEIGEQLFVSESTIKTHTSNLFSKLNVSRRTQALQKAKEIGIIA